MNPCSFHHLLLLIDRILRNRYSKKKFEELLVEYSDLIVVDFELILRVLLLLLLVHCNLIDSIVRCSSKQTEVEVEVVEECRRLESFHLVGCNRTELEVQEGVAV